MVNTFLIHTDFALSAGYLDRARLGKQRVEAYQILLICEKQQSLAVVPLNKDWTRDEKKQWIRAIPYSGKRGFWYHPAVLMWLGYEEALKAYINAHIEEWIRRGYKNTMELYTLSEKYDRPAWTFDETLHLNHRAALMKKEITRKEKPWYRIHLAFQALPVFVNYIWP